MLDMADARATASTSAVSSRRHNVHSWHWPECVCLEWSSARLSSLLKGLTILETATTASAWPKARRAGGARTWPGQGPRRAQFLRVPGPMVGTEKVACQVPVLARNDFVPIPPSLVQTPETARWHRHHVELAAQQLSHHAGEAAGHT